MNMKKIDEIVQSKDKFEGRLEKRVIHDEQTFATEFPEIDYLKVGDSRNDDWVDKIVAFHISEGSIIQVVKLSSGAGDVAKLVVFGEPRDRLANLLQKRERHEAAIALIDQEIAELKP
jgi:hypothetical protein